MPAIVSTLVGVGCRRGENTAAVEGEETAAKQNLPRVVGIAPTYASESTVSPPENPTVSQSATAQPVERTVTLWNVGGTEFKSNLLQALGDRLTSRRGPAGTEYVLSPGDKKSLRLAVDETNNIVSIAGAETAVRDAMQLTHALDNQATGSAIGIRCVAAPRVHRKEVGRLLEAVRSGQSRENTVGQAGIGTRNMQGAPLTVAMQNAAPADSSSPAVQEQKPNGQNAAPAAAPTSPAAPPEAARAAEAGRLVAPVQVQTLEGMDALIIRGRPEDVKRVADLIKQLEEYSKVTEPTIELLPLKHVDVTAMGTLLNQLYEKIFSAREGTLSITALAGPNSLLFIGRPESVKKIMELTARLDQPSSPTARFRIFRLKNVPSTEAEESITEFFAKAESDDEEKASLEPRVRVVADFRSNSIIVRASENDMAEVAAIVARLDSSDSEAFNEVRVFNLKNASAETLAPILQDAITGQMYGQRARTGPVSAAVMSQAQDYEKKSTRLKMVTIDAQGHTVLSSGILTDAQVTADPRTNSVVVTASDESMPLIAALIRQLDQPPTVESQVKVFTLANGDATNMAEMLQNIFGAAVAGDEIAVRTGIVPDETSLVGLNFAVDVRTNSIIVTGSAGALTVVEAVLSRLDGNDPRERKTAVYRIRNVNANDVATAVNQYLTNKRQIETSAQNVLSTFEQLDREVIVVPETATNSLIISATPRYFDDISKLIRDIDRRLPMIMIQVVIAEVALNNFDEFGIELSLEDSLLFNRNLSTSNFAIPGTLFSNGESTGGSGVTSLGVGQINSELGYGGLVLSASSESVSALIRALSTCSRVKVLSRPQVMTLDNEPAQVIVGEDVPFITGTSFSEFGQQNSIDYREVGLILSVTPRVSEEGQVVMEIIATNSKVGPEDEGIPVSVADNQVIRSPRIEMISATTVVSAFNGQTVVLGGLITEHDELYVRRVPGLSSIPIVGNLFKYESTTKNRKELLIIMTPRIVDNAAEANRIAQVEASRLHWCRCDVQRLHGGYGGDPFLAPACPADGPMVIYPDDTPTLDMMPEIVPQPMKEMMPEYIPQGEGAEIIPSPQGMPAVQPQWAPGETPAPQLQQPGGGLEYPPETSVRPANSVVSANWTTSSNWVVGSPKGAQGTSPKTPQPEPPSSIKFLSDDGSYMERANNPTTISSGF